MPKNKLKHKAWHPFYREFENLQAEFKKKRKLEPVYFYLLMILNISVKGKKFSHLDAIQMMVKCALISCSYFKFILIYFK